VDRALRRLVDPPAVSAVSIFDNVPLAPYTTLELGGPARHLARISDDRELREALVWADARALPTFFLGGGSNVVVPDAGFPGLVVHVVPRGLRIDTAAAAEARVEVAAGEPWDDVVAATVEAGLAGLECLSGIPGLAGGTPVQNVGAYGQELAERVVSVRALDRATGAMVELDPAACGFAYRDSVFKREPGRRVVLGVTLRLVPGGRAHVRYPELRDALGGPEASVVEARAAVLALRRKKSMVLGDVTDPNRRSVGSFFTNPIVSAAEAAEVVGRALAAGCCAHEREIPRFPQPDGRVKLAAGWLIERAGITRGLRHGAVGVSTAHALALVHHGGGSTAALLALAEHVRAAVAARFGVTLVLEPVLVRAG
jgi:UDP-N-acetylmuramate dehydrogenase